MLRDQLKHLVEAEIEQTCQLSVMMAAGYTSTDAKRALGMSQAEFLIARERIARIAGEWVADEH